MSTLIFGIVSFFLHALVLKLAIATMGVPHAKNSYTKALGIAFALSVAGLLVGCIPVASYLIYGVLWMAVIMSAYDLGVFKSLGVAIVQVGLKVVLWLIFKAFGIHMLLWHH